MFLIVSGGLLVKSLGKIARFLHISEFSAAFIIMALATSLPELFIGISSALDGAPELSLGNVLGANILNLTLVTGIIVLVSKNIKTNKKIERDSYFMLWGIILMIVLYILGGQLSRVDGVLLLGFFSLNFYRTFKKRRKFSKKMEDSTGRKKHFIYLLLFIVAFVGLYVSSVFVVKYSEALAVDLSLPEIFMGLFFLSFATTLPELVFGVSAAKMNHNSMGIGDQIGTILANSALILGIVAIIHPIKIPVFLNFITPAVFMFIAAFIFTTFLITGRKLETLEGISLVLFYVLFIIIQSVIT